MFGSIRYRIVKKEAKALRATPTHNGINKPVEVIMVAIIPPPPIPNRNIPKITVICFCTPSRVETTSPMYAVATGIVAETNPLTKHAPQNAQYENLQKYFNIEPKHDADKQNTIHGFRPILSDREPIPREAIAAPNFAIIIKNVTAEL